MADQIKVLFGSRLLGAQGTLYLIWVLMPIWRGQGEEEWGNVAPCTVPTHLPDGATFNATISVFGCQKVLYKWCSFWKKTIVKVWYTWYSIVS